MVLLIFTWDDVGQSAIALYGDDKEKEKGKKEGKRKKERARHQHSSSLLFTTPYSSLQQLLFDIPGRARRTAFSLGIQT
jgi:hypothetical protein